MNVNVPVPPEQIVFPDKLPCGNAFPFPDSPMVGELLPDVVLDTVIVALCEPLPDGVKVTWYVPLPFAGIVVDDILLTTNCALLETTVIPLAVPPVLFIV